ncbi:MAG: hypothetical protein PUP92_27920 [Rhizonema sp. PD38]|nr:hypothetical protein [Rhizonema sp. PD38]
MDFLNYDAPEPQKTDSIPQLTTKETAGMRDRYPNIEHLEAGNVGSWLQERRDQLWESARTIESEVDAAKVITLAVAATGLVLNAVNPFALAGGAVASAAYIWTLVKDYHQTKQFAPLPLVRGNFFEFLSAMGDSVARGHYSVNHDVETLKFLEARDRMEYACLHDKFETVAQYLTQVETGKRFHAYRWIQQVFTRYKAIPSAEAMHDHLKDIELDIRINALQVTTIQQKRPEFIDIPKPKTISSDVIFGKQPEQRIGEETKLKAFGTTAKKLTDMDVQVYVPPTPLEFDLVGRMGRDATSHLIVGVPGAGKGILISNAISSIKEHHPEITTFYIDPKNDLKETGYFSNGVDFIRRADSRVMTPSSCIEWVKESVRQFEAIPGDKLLIFDESTLISSKFKLGKESDWLKDKLIGYASAGDSIGLRIWIVAQNAHVDDLGISGGVRSQFVPIALISSKNIAALGALMATQFIPKNQKLSTDEVEDIIRKSEVNRAVYHGGVNEWFPAKKLPNLSGYDRDSRTFEVGFPEESVGDVVNLKLDSPTVVAEITKPCSLSERAKQVLDYFNAVKSKEPKTLRDMKKADRLAGLDDVILIISLTELVTSNYLKFDGTRAWSKSEW